MQNKPIISLATNIFLGYPLEIALQKTSDAGFTGVEIACIDDVCEHIAVEHMNSELAAIIKTQLQDLNLIVNAFGAHVDPTEEKGLQRLLKKMEFAKGIGAQIVNTNAGPANRLPEFYKNIKVIINKAEQLNIKVGLEPHGDIINTGRESVTILKKINHPLIRINYDTGNVFYHSAGKVRPEEDILYAIDYIDYVHLKDIKVDGRHVSYCPLGDGHAGIEKILGVLKEYPTKIPITVEVPVYLHCIDWQPLTKNPVPLEFDVIAGVLNRSQSCILSSNFS